MSTKTSSRKPRAVIVCTERRGVFFGRTTSPGAPPEMSLSDARMAIYWGTTGGVVQLAATGPTGKSRIGSRAPVIHLRGVTAVIDCSPEATHAWDVLP